PGKECLPVSRNSPARSSFAQEVAEPIESGNRWARDCSISSQPTRLLHYRGAGAGKNVPPGRPRDEPQQPCPFQAGSPSRPENRALISGTPFPATNPSPAEILSHRLGRRQL